MSEKSLTVMVGDLPPISPELDKIIESVPNATIPSVSLAVIQTERDRLLAAASELKRRQEEFEEMARKAADAADAMAAEIAKFDFAVAAINKIIKKAGVS